MMYWAVCDFATDSVAHTEARHVRFGFWYSEPHFFPLSIAPICSGPSFLLFFFFFSSFFFSFRRYILCVFDIRRLSCLYLIFTHVCVSGFYCLAPCSGTNVHAHAHKHIEARAHAAGHQHQRRPHISTQYKSGLVLLRYISVGLFCDGRVHASLVLVLVCGCYIFNVSIFVLRRLRFGYDFFFTSLRSFLSLLFVRCVDRWFAVSAYACISKCVRECVLCEHLLLFSLREQFSFFLLRIWLARSMLVGLLDQWDGKAIAVVRARVCVCTRQTINIHARNICTIFIVVDTRTYSTECGYERVSQCEVWTNTLAWVRRAKADLVRRVDNKIK